VAMIAGDNDQVVNPDQTSRLHAILSQSVVRIVSEASHMVHHAAPNELIEAIGVITSPNEEPFSTRPRATMKAACLREFSPSGDRRAALAAASPNQVRLQSRRASDRSHRPAMPEDRFGCLQRRPRVALAKLKVLSLIPQKVLFVLSARSGQTAPCGDQARVDRKQPPECAHIHTIHRSDAPRVRGQDRG
jgi:hypothetical protein